MSKQFNNTLRLAHEVAHYKILIVEDIEELINRVRFFGLRERSIPFYTITEDSPPDLDLCLEYYRL